MEMNPAGRPKRLVILSVPYLRVARSLLAPQVLGVIGNAADILVVGPFAEEDAFRADFARPGVQFLTCEARTALPRRYRYLYACSELLRMQGFWFRHRHHGLGYYWLTDRWEFGDDGADRLKPLGRRLLHNIAGVIGRWRASWRTVDLLFRGSLYRFPELEARLASYEAVTLVQASSWGFQDRMLAALARSHGMRTVLLPYTTDQLWVNGHLLSEYDVVCLQGPFEARCAKEYHDIPSERLAALGCMWFRNVDGLRRQNLVREGSNGPGRLRRILYAGVARQYFPRESEYDALAALLRAARAGRFGSVEIVYRPYALDAEERRGIEARVARLGDVEIQWPEEACAGLDSFAGNSVEPQLLQYLSRLGAADVVIMSHTTSLGWDAAYLGTGVVANFADATGVLERRRTELRFRPGKKLDCAPGLPVARSLDELITLVASQLADPALAREAAHKIIDEWDFRAPDVAERLRRAVFGEALAEPAGMAAPDAELIAPGL